MELENRLFDVKEQSPVQLDDITNNMLDYINMSREYVSKFAYYMNSPYYPDAGFVADTIKLPIDKETLKTSLKMVIYTTEDEAVKNILKAAYISLAYFQQGVGSNDVGIDIIGYSNKLANIDDNNMLDVFKQYSADIAASKHWLDIATQEIQQLTADVATL